MDQKSKTEISTSSPASISQLPPIKQLIVESWQLLTKKALKLLFLGLLSVAVHFALLMMGILVIFGFGAKNMSMSLFLNPEVMTDVLSIPGFVETTVTIFVIWMIASIAIGTAFQAGMLILLKDPTEETSVITYFKSGFSYIVPLIAVSAATFLLIFGSFFVFIIPAFIIGIFLMFTTYIVVLDNKKGMEAIKMSIGVVSQNFGAIIGRIVILWLVSFAVQMIIGALPQEEPSAVMFFVLIMLVSSFAISWFGLAYIFKLYEHARAAYDDKKPTSMTWMWIISILGWIIGAMIVTGIVSAVGNKDFQKKIKDAVNSEMESESNKELDFENDGDFDESLTL